MDKEDSHVKGEGGLLKTGQWYILGVQLLGCVCISVWTIGTSFLVLKVSKGLLMDVLGIEDSNHGFSQM